MNQKMITFVMMNYEKYKNYLVSDFLFNLNDSPSWQEYVDSQLFYKKYQSKIDTLVECLKLAKEYEYTISIESFPQSSFDYVFSYLNKKLKKCKLGSDNYNKTMRDIGFVKNGNYDGISYDHNLYSQITRLRSYVSNKEGMQRRKEKNELIKKAHMYKDYTIKQLAEEVSFLRI